MIRTAVIALVLLSAVFIIGHAGPPIDGDYQSTDMGGNVNAGRYSEAWIVPNGALNLGTTLNTQSWNGSALGVQWRYYCGSIQTPPVLLSDFVDANGNGNRTYMKTFVGGFIWLSGTGPWANGDPDYPGVIDNYVEFETIQYYNWQRVAAVTNVQSTAHFDNYPNSCLVFSVANGSEVGSTDFGMTKPGDYPDLLQELTCSPTMTLGGW